MNLSILAQEILDSLTQKSFTQHATYYSLLLLNCMVLLYRLLLKDRITQVLTSNRSLDRQGGQGTKVMRSFWFAVHEIRWFF